MRRQHGSSKLNLLTTFKVNSMYFTRLLLQEPPLPRATLHFRMQEHQQCGRHRSGGAALKRWRLSFKATPSSASTCSVTMSEIESQQMNAAIAHLFLLFDGGFIST
jgi:hypothetical protein